MTDDDSLAVPPYWHENGSGLYPSRAAKWVVDVWTEEKLVLRWMHSLEEDLFVLPTTRTLNRMSLHVGILMRNGQFWMSLLLYQLFFLFIETWVISKDLEVCHFERRLLENYLKTSTFLSVTFTTYVLQTPLKECSLVLIGGRDEQSLGWWTFRLWMKLQLGIFFSTGTISDEWQMRPYLWAWERDFRVLQLKRTAGIISGLRGEETIGCSQRHFCPRSPGTVDCSWMCRFKNHGLDLFHSRNFPPQKKTITCQACWYRPIIPALRRLSREERFKMSCRSSWVTYYVLGQHELHSEALSQK